MILLSVTILFVITYVIMMAWLIAGWRRLPEVHVPPGFVPDISVAVIIPARNEEENISHCLESLLHQTYPKELLEVVVVNDHSEDETLEIAKRFEQHGVKIIDLIDYIPSQTEIRSYKKLAIETGINSTKSSVIITMDADCTVEFSTLR